MSPSRIFIPRRFKNVKRTVLAIVILILTACRNSPTPTIPAFTATHPLDTQTRAPTTQPTDTRAPVTIVWHMLTFDAEQLAINQQVADEFNAAQSDIYLKITHPGGAILYDFTNPEVILSHINADIYGPFEVSVYELFHDQWLNLEPYLQANHYDLSQYNQNLIGKHQTDQGLIGLPLYTYPSAIFFNPRLFREAGVNPPPAHYGEEYAFSGTGASVEWNWDTLADVARSLTLDASGRHSGEAGFDKNAIQQYGFSFEWINQPTVWAVYQSTGGQMLVPGGKKGSFEAQIPQGWNDAWRWLYDGTWGEQPFIPTDDLTGSGGYSGNVFTRGKVAMLACPSWFLVPFFAGEHVKAGEEFEFGAMPVGREGQVAGRVHSSTFLVWKGTKHPEEAVKVLIYLSDVGIQKLVIGDASQKPAYDGIPAKPALFDPWLQTQKKAYPFVQNWDTLLAGMDYPDIPDAYSYTPNYGEAIGRIQTFGDLLKSTEGLDLAAEEAKLITDLEVIFNK